MQSPNEKPHYSGHRQRLRNKFLSDPKSISNHELLEMLLFYAFLRKDTKPTAKALLHRFKSLKEMISADRGDLKKVNGVGESTAILLSLVHEISNRMLLEKISESAAVMSAAHVVDYYKNALGQAKKEQLRVMFLNNRNKLISEEIMQEGTVNNTAVYPREIVQRALEHGAGAIIMVHNHPSGDPTPSKQDIIMTKMISDIVGKLDIVLLDHIIISKTGTVSLKEQGII
ncbi:MAG: DNA repair protein RadC [Holosporaceae bacterium]|jgi:DNA repair protein RadC|nr:DNA repair protein RadC [Holosporaceae bacterium]